ncbi:ABC transporter substrate-binding protein [Noviherbaspirillum sedimenti]|uniref:ABC transporter substrate-binding protein n=1 Tax=Noviherbaspirillum sedimenti TaxID=2320865 RepID=A0A3A3G392_9BURK|nr:ABC transporter substrate-binding protein [Noviherbaspirillum sedimenti]RJG02958.1 ABC transporter substrate-binding protein [Noviherbaspirillum sedimenti]
MTISSKSCRRAVFLSLAALAAASSAHANVSDDVIRIGVLTDMQGPYSDIGGKGSVTAAKMAIADFGGMVLGKKIEIVVGDHQNKTDVGVTTLLKWFDNDKVDAIFELNNSALHIAAARIATQKNKILINTGAAAASITGENCSLMSVHYTYDTYALANSTTKAMAQQGAKNFYILAVDYALGAALTKDITEASKQSGGTIVGTTRHPLNASDFSSFLLQAQSAKADVIALANAGGDTINTIKAAKQFQVTDKQKLMASILYINDVHTLGLETAQGMFASTAFYWDLNDETRAWSRRFFNEHKKMPAQPHAGIYSAVLTYLKAIKVAGTDESSAVMASMRKERINDMFAKNAYIREDGRMVHDMYLVKVKSPAESKYAWDYYKVVATIPGDKAFRPLAESACPLVKK